MITKQTRLWTVLGVVSLGALGAYGFMLGFGLTNRAQEFGTYGQYNRVLRVIRGMDGFEVVDSRLSRRLDWRNLGHLDRFAVNLRDVRGQTASIDFVHGSPEMDVRDPKSLEQIIQAKFRDQLGRASAAIQRNN